MRACFYRRTSLGMIRIEEKDERIVKLSFEEQFPDEEECEIVETACLWQAFQQLQEYLDGKRKSFELILHPEGTEFQREAWQALMEIPYGQTWSYRQQAEHIGKPQSVRSMGRADHANPIPIFIPCHRVIASDGSLSGYSGGEERKQFLLDLEKEGVADE